MISALKLLPAVAPVVGSLVLSIPLERSSSLERQGDVVIMRRSSGFLVMLLALLAVRLLLHDYVGHLLPPLQTGALFFLLAFGMIARWRTTMYVRFRRLLAEGPARDQAEPQD